MKKTSLLIGVLFLLTSSLSCAKTQPVSQSEIAPETPAQIIPPDVVAESRKAFAGYLGDNEEAWKQYDATELIRSRRQGSTPDRAGPMH